MARGTPRYFSLFIVHLCYVVDGLSVCSLVSLYRYVLTSAFVGASGSDGWSSIFTWSDSLSNPFFLRIDYWRAKFVLLRGAVRDNVSD
ncbi:hypothetical protein IWZ03DRAFT_22841 [Phyllosticta citriasiana]|uniref:Secreted protein n=1 Tax=Phyllosticta citriasiana TaxID=595635 RepID=A0ABR1L1C0_9PEZI